MAVLHAIRNATRNSKFARAHSGLPCLIRHVLRTAPLNNEQLSDKLVSETQLPEPLRLPHGDTNVLRPASEQPAAIYLSSNKGKAMRFLRATGAQLKLTLPCYECAAVVQVRVGIAAVA